MDQRPNDEKQNCKLSKEMQENISVIWDTYLLTEDILKVDKLDYSNTRNICYDKRHHIKEAKK